jgi:hypothetical protein
VYRVLLVLVAFRSRLEKQQTSPEPRFSRSIFSARLLQFVSFPSSPNHGGRIRRLKPNLLVGIIGGWTLSCYNNRRRLCPPCTKTSPSRHGRDVWHGLVKPSAVTLSIDSSTNCAAAKSKDGACWVDSHSCVSLSAAPASDNNHRDCGEAEEMMSSDSVQGDNNRQHQAGDVALSFATDQALRMKNTVSRR